MLRRAAIPAVFGGFAVGPAFPIELSLCPSMHLQESAPGRVAGTGARGARNSHPDVASALLPMTDDKIAKFRIGQVVRHRVYPFRGVIFDVDPVFNSTEEWWESIPEHVRPRKDQPFYHLLAENESTSYIAYVSEQNLLVDESGEPVQHPQVSDLFGELQAGQYAMLDSMIH